MRVMTLKEAHDFVTAPPPEGLGMTITLKAFTRLAEPDAEGRRRLPFFKEHGAGKHARLLITDEALRAHYKRLSDAAVKAVAA